jgi:hypothetical protein
VAPTPTIGSSVGSASTFATPTESSRSSNGRTRLISRNRFNTSGYSPKDWLGYAVMEPGSWVMERKMVRTLEERAEHLARKQRGEPS